MRYLVKQIKKKFCDGFTCMSGNVTVELRYIILEIERYYRYIITHIDLPLKGKLRDSVFNVVQLCRFRYSLEVLVKCGTFGHFMAQSKILKIIIE